MFSTSSSECVDVFLSTEKLFALRLCSDLVYTIFCVLVFVAEPAPPRSLYAVNATHSSVTLLWTEEGVVDYYQVLCKPNKPSKELKVKQHKHLERKHHLVRHLTSVIWFLRAE